MYSLEKNIKSKLLKKQIKKYLNFLKPKDYEKFKYFLNAIDEEYTYQDERLILVEQSLEVSSSELSEKNNEISNMLEENIKIARQLEETKNNLALIIDNLWEWLIVINEEAKIILLNKKASLMTWYEKDFLIGKQYKEHINFIFDKWEKSLEEFIFDTLEKWVEHFFNSDIFLLGKEIKTPISLISSPLENFISWKRSCILVFRDATKERELENLKNEFISVTSHELRTPLTVIREYINLFLKGKFWSITNIQRNYFDRILLNTNSLISLVNDSLDISKIESWKIQYNFRETDIKELMLNTIEWFKSLLEGKNISIETYLSDITASTDQDKLKQIITNLISNAYKFTNLQWKIIVRLHKWTKEEYFFISVEDNGIGIKKEDVKNLFNKFYQIWSHLNKTEKWTGLWLFICKNMVEWMGWEIFVESRYWEGTKFSFILPMRSSK